MVPTGTVTDHNVYKEYIVLDIEKNGVINRVLEQIGSWDVNLSDYATVKQLSALQEQVDNLASMDNSIIKSVDTEKFSITSSGELKLLNLPISQITDLTNILNKGQQTDGGYHLINQEEKRKLDALVISEENGDLEISATVEASKVQGLDKWITEHSTDKNHVIGLSENNLTDERVTKLDNMLGIVSTDSSLKINEQGQLQLNNISISQVTNLDSILNSKVNTTLFSAMDLRVGATEKKIKNLEEAFTWEELH